MFLLKSEQVQIGDFVIKEELDLKCDILML